MTPPKGHVWWEASGLTKPFTFSKIGKKPQLRNSSYPHLCISDVHLHPTILEMSYRRLIAQGLLESEQKAPAFHPISYHLCFPFFKSIPSVAEPKIHPASPLRLPWRRHTCWCLLINFHLTQNQLNETLRIHCNIQHKVCVKSQGSLSHLELPPKCKCRTQTTLSYNFCCLSTCLTLGDMKAKKN